MNYVKQAAITVAAVGLASCATSTPIDYDAISGRIEAGQSAAIISTFKPSGSRVVGFGKDLLLSASVKATNMDNQYTKTLYFSESGKLQPIAPGRYKIESGSFRGPNVSGNMPLISLWTETFEIKAGEVVDLGELDIERIKVNVQTSGGSKTFNAITSFGTDLNDDQTYVTYAAGPSSDKDIKKALEKYPALENAVISRPLKMRFTEVEFREAVALASEKTADGKLPTRSEVQQKLNMNLMTMTFKSIVDDMRADP